MSMRAGSLPACSALALTRRVYLPSAGAATSRKTSPMAVKVRPLPSAFASTGLPSMSAGSCSPVSLTLACSSTIALSRILVLASKYFSSRIGGSESTSPMSSKPSPTSSAGKSDDSLRSSPIRSRMVLSYSLRLSRRMVTRPGSGGPLGRLRMVIPLSSRSHSSAVGCADFSGGMSFARSRSRTRCQILPAFRAASSLAMVDRLRSPFCLSGPWHLTQ